MNITANMHTQANTYMSPPNTALVILSPLLNSSKECAGQHYS